ncbi:hypothetical protein DOY81_011249, partial [Sarcophaga bullata]
CGGLKHNRLEEGTRPTIVYKINVPPFEHNESDTCAIIIVYREDLMSTEGLISLAVSHLGRLAFYAAAAAAAGVGAPSCHCIADNNVCVTLLL